MGHEGQVHQTHPEEGVKVREQIRQTAGEGGQVRIRQPAQTVQVIPNSSIFTKKIWSGQSKITVLYCTLLYITVVYSTVMYLYCILLYRPAQFYVVHGVFLTDSCPNRLYSVSLL